MPYKDAASSFRDLITGELQAIIQPLQTAAPYVQNGNVRMLAVMSAERAPAFPDVPTMRELGFPNFVVETWYGMFAPAGTPSAIVAKWNAEINAILRAGPSRAAPPPAREQNPRPPPPPARPRERKTNTPPPVGG